MATASCPGRDHSGDPGSERSAFAAACRCLAGADSPSCRSPHSPERLAGGKNRRLRNLEQWFADRQPFPDRNAPRARIWHFPLMEVQPLRTGHAVVHCLRIQLRARRLSLRRERESELKKIGEIAPRICAPAGGVLQLVVDRFRRSVPRGCRRTSGKSCQLLGMGGCENWFYVNLNDQLPWRLL